MTSGLVKGLIIGIPLGLLCWALLASLAWLVSQGILFFCQ